MNKRTRLIVSLLIAVVVILGAAIARFYLNIPDNKKNSSSDNEIAQIIDGNGMGSFIFSDGKGGYGISQSDRIIVAPEWQELSFAGDQICIAGRKKNGKMRYGCIDCEGSVVVPIIYSFIGSGNIGDKRFYKALSCDDGSVVLYNEKFVPVFRQPWVSCEVLERDLVLTDEKGEYTYTVANGDLLFKSASASGEVMGCAYDLEIISRVLLSKLTVPMIEDMLSGAEDYLEYAFGGDQEKLSKNGRSGFIPLFGEDDRIVSKKLMGIPEIHIYALRSEGDMPRYEVSVTADIEVVYFDESGERQTIRDNYKASVEYRGSNETDISAVSGRFEDSKPKYPEKAPEMPEVQPDYGEIEPYYEEQVYQ